MVRLRVLCGVLFYQFKVSVCSLCPCGFSLLTLPLCQIWKAENQTRQCRPLHPSHDDPASIQLKGEKNKEYNRLIIIQRCGFLWAWLTVCALNNRAHKQCLCRLFFNSLRSPDRMPLSLTNNGPAWLLHTFSKRDKNTDLGSGIRGGEGGFLCVALWIVGARVSWRTALWFSLSIYDWLSRRERERERCLLSQVWFGLYEVNTLSVSSLSKGMWLTLTFLSVDVFFVSFKLSSMVEEELFCIRTQSCSDEWSVTSCFIVLSL